MRSIENVISVGGIEKTARSGKIYLASKGAIAKNYLDILKDLFAEKEITKEEFSELKRKYENNLQQYSHS